MFTCYVKNLLTSDCTIRVFSVYDLQHKYRISKQITLANCQKFTIKFLP